MADTLKPKRLSTSLRPSRTGTAAGRPGPAGPGGVPLRRRWGRVAGGLGAAVVGMWAFAALYLSAGDKEEVLVVGSSVQRYEPVTSADLETIRVSLDPGADSISASDVDDYFDRRAATELLPGTILTEDHFMDEDAQVIEAGEELVATSLAPEEFAAEEAKPGDAVRIVVRPSTGTGGEPEPYDGGRVYRIGSEDENSGDRQVTFLVPTNDADVISAAAADSRVSVNLLDN